MWRLGCGEQTHQMRQTNQMQQSRAAPQRRAADGQAGNQSTAAACQMMCDAGRSPSDPPGLGYLCLQPDQVSSFKHQASSIKHQASSPLQPAAAIAAQAEALHGAQALQQLTHTENPPAGRIATSAHTWKHFASGSQNLGYGPLTSGMLSLSMLEGGFENSWAHCCSRAC